METFKALVISRDGAECRTFVHTNMTTVSTLGAILSDGRLHRETLFLTEKEINEIKDTSNVGRIEQDWCWDDRLWCRTRSDNMSFEMDLLFGSALHVCYYRCLF
jgi:hypothetical protein